MICNQTEEWQRSVHEPEEREEEVKEGQTRATDNANSFHFISWNEMKWNENSVQPTPTVCVEVKEDNIGINKCPLWNKVMHYGEIWQVYIPTHTF
jgi:hypothetical protein